MLIVNGRKKNIVRVEEETVVCTILKQGGMDFMCAIINKRYFLKDGTIENMGLKIGCEFPSYPGGALKPFSNPHTKIDDILAEMDEWKGKEDSEEFIKFVQQLENIIPETK